MLLDYVTTFFSELFVLFGEMAPYLLLGFLFAGVLKAFFPKRLIQKYIGGSDLRSVINASLLGVPMPLCSCGVLPAGISFHKQGASRGATVSFLISTPQTGVDSIIATYAMLGLPLAIIRPVIALFSGILGGAMTNYIGDRVDSVANQLEDRNEKPDRSLREMFRYGFVELVQDISKWLIIGFLVAALLAILIPGDFFVETISNEYLSMLIVLAASIPLYVCATGSIPIAAVLLMKGLSPGAAIVFLMAGPATNAATMAVISNSLGRRTFWVYLTSIIGGAMLFGAAVNELIPRNWIMGGLPDLHAAMDHHANNWLKIASAIILLLLIINGYIQRFIKRNETPAISGNELSLEKFTKYSVEGMTCKNCKAAVEKGIQGLDPEASVIADPSANELRISSGALSESTIKSRVESLGYIFKGKL